jgi:hypothetical protein
VTQPKLAIHGHFYQPERRDPFSGQVPPQPSAAPYRDWNARIDAECYRPNVERGNLRHISYDLGPTLATWLKDNDAATHAGFVASDLPPHIDVPGRGNAMAQAYHHTILPLASLADRRTEIRWGLRDFELRFNRRATGMWLPETAVDLLTLRILADEGVRYTILAPWQAEDSRLDTRRPYRVDLGGDRAIIVVFFDAGLSAAASFEPGATVDADSFARERVSPRLADPSFSDDAPLMAVIATDGEMYGHHQESRDLFLARLANPGPDAPEWGFEITTVGQIVDGMPASEFLPTQVAERTSWSCHHGVLRWTGECPDTPDGRWKGPLRAALERLASAMDTVAERLAADFMEPAALWRARDQYVDVIFGAEPAEDFAKRYLPLATREQQARFLDMLEAERWRLAMFASDGWYWDDPVGLETKQVLICAAKAAQMVDGAAGTNLEGRLMDDLSLFTSPSARVDGTEIYSRALSEAGQSPASR